MRWFCDEAEFEASWEAWKAWAKMEEAPWRALNSAARLEHADFTKSLLDTGWCMGHRCRESLGAVFQPRRSRATSRAPCLRQRGAVACPAAGPTDANGGHTR